MTATASHKVFIDVCKILQLQNPYLFKSPLNRPNLYYEVRLKREKFVVDEIADFINENFKDEPGIIYCLSRKESETLAGELVKKGINASYYHAALDVDDRARVHDEWAADQVKVIVATIAFGMGINKRDVRFVIHHSLSQNLETYYQESGRAGRDGLPAVCLLFYSLGDVERLVKTVRNPENFLKIVAYCEENRRCRRRVLLEYLEEDTSNLAPNPNCCDFCYAVGNIPGHVENITQQSVDVLKILKEVESTQKKITINKLIHLWRGYSVKDISVSTPFTTVRNWSEEKCEHVIANLLVDKFIEAKIVSSGANSHIYIQSSPRHEELFQSDFVYEKFFVDEKKLPPKKYCQGADYLKEAISRAVNNIAKKHGKKPTTIATPSNIDEICKSKPNTLEQLKKFMAPSRVDKYGNDLLEVIIPIYAKALKKAKKRRQRQLQALEEQQTQSSLNDDSAVEYLGILNDPFQISPSKDQDHLIPQSKLEVDPKSEVDVDGTLPSKKEVAIARELEKLKPKKRKRKEEEDTEEEVIYDVDKSLENLKPKKKKKQKKEEAIQIVDDDYSTESADEIIL